MMSLVSKSQGECSKPNIPLAGTRDIFEKKEKNNTNSQILKVQNVLKNT